MLLRPKRRPVPTAQSAHLPAPMGGLNTISAGSAMPATDCIQMFNLIAAEYGLRSRLGQREWATGLEGLVDSEVRSIIPFTGSAANGAQDRLFAATALGLWDVSDSGDQGAADTWLPSTAYVIGNEVVNDGNVYVCTADGTSDVSGGPTGTGAFILDGTTEWDWVEAAPAVALVTFGIQTDKAGYGIHHAFVTSAGHFLFYADEENGLYMWSESGAAWTQIASGTTVAWQPSTTYRVGNRVTNDGNVYQCDTQGISAASGGPTGTGTNIVDGTTRWDYVAAVTAGVMGPSLADQNAGYSADPANFCFVMAWKNRLVFVEKNSTRAWYLEAGAIAGTLTSLNFGTQFRAGGSLRGLWNWTRDSGAGMDDALVAVSGGGDVAVYEGTDPASANTFGLKGVWYAGGLPTGRRIATDFGGDMLLLTRLGAIPLSRLLGGAGEERSQYATAKIQNLFNALMLSKATLDGWALRLHPEDNALIVTVPTFAGQATEQLAMSLGNRSWSRYRDLPILSMEVWGGKLYFGTADGRVCINDGYVDGVTLEDPDSFTPVHWSCLTGFSNLGNGRQKQVQMVRPTILSESAQPTFSVAAKYRYDFSELAPPTGGAGGEGAWDTAEWDSAVWGGEYVASQLVRGAAGMGVDVAIAIRGQATSRTVLVGFDVTFTQGGFL